MKPYHQWKYQAVVVVIIVDMVVLPPPIVYFALCAQKVYFNFFPLFIAPILVRGSNVLIMYLARRRRRHTILFYLMMINIISFFCMIVCPTEKKLKVAESKLNRGKVKSKLFFTSVKKTWLMYTFSRGWIFFSTLLGFSQWITTAQIHPYSLFYFFPLCGCSKLSHK